MGTSVRVSLLSLRWSDRRHRIRKDGLRVSMWYVLKRAAMKASRVRNTHVTRLGTRTDRSQKDSLSWDESR